MLARRKELTVRLDEDQYERLREAVYRLRISQNRAMQEALEMWLAKEDEQVFTPK